MLHFFVLDVLKLYMFSRLKYLKEVQTLSWIVHGRDLGRSRFGTVHWLKLLHLVLVLLLRLDLGIDFVVFIIELCNFILLDINLIINKVINLLFSIIL